MQAMHIDVTPFQYSYESRFMKKIAKDNSSLCISSGYLVISFDVNTPRASRANELQRASGSSQS